MPLEPCERETIVNCSDEDRTWVVYTRQKVIMTKLERANWDCTKVWKDSDGTILAKEFRAPFESITFRNQEKKKREMTEAQKEMARLRLASGRKKKENDNNGN